MTSVVGRGVGLGNSALEKVDQQLSYVSALLRRQRWERAYLGGARVEALLCAARDESCRLIFNLRFGPCFAD